MIAKKAGVGQGTFYRNFPSREALVLEMHRHEVRQLTDSATELLEAPLGIPGEATRPHSLHSMRSVHIAPLGAPVLPDV